MKILFISNITNEITNFAIPSIYASKNLGIEFHHAANWSNVSEDIRKEEEEKYGIKIHNIDFERNPFRLRNYKAYKQLLNLMKENSFDVVHCNTPIGGILGRICARQLGVSKVIYTAHGFHFYKGAPFINNTIYKWVERYLARYTDSIITINQEDYEAAHQFKLRNKGEVYYVPGVGVNVEEYKNIVVDRDKKRDDINVPKECKLIIMVGELIPRKNYDTAIRAISKVNNNNLHCIICGTGSEEKNLKQLCKDLNIEDRIHFLGFRKDVVELMKASDIFLFTTYQEGLARALMEAMACGIAPIVSRIRGNVDLIDQGENGYLFIPSDYELISNYINEVIEDEILVEKMISNNFDKIEDFSIDKIRDEMLKIYSSMIRYEKIGV